MLQGSGRAQIAAQGRRKQRPYRRTKMKRPNSLFCLLTIIVLPIWLGACVTNTPATSRVVDAAAPTLNLPDAPPAPTPPVTLAQVEAVIGKNCMGGGACHVNNLAMMPPQGLNMTPGMPPASTDPFYSNTVNIGSAEDPSLMRIVPGDLGHSYLWCKLVPTGAACVKAQTTIIGSQMPKGQSLEASELNIIRDWIL